MIRRRLYNPAQLTPDELKASFVARRETLEEMLRLLREQTPSRPCQHMMLIGPRGMGKTTLGLRFLHAVEETPELAAIWQPVPFHEESYGIGDLADFWLAALRHLSRATDNSEWADRAHALAKDQRDQERLAAYALAALVDHCQASGRRLILFVENLDGILRQLRNEREAHALRASLIERPEILLIGSANAVFDAIHSHAQPFYEFFRLVILEGIGPEETARLLETLAGREGRPDVPQALNLERGRLETLRRLTGGNPRLLVLACRMLIESPLGSAFEDLEQLIDEQTPYFKARIEELPIQARKVFHCLADGWTPLLAKEVAGAAKLSSSHASAQLKQLVERGYAQEVRLPGAKRTRYEVGDRFYNIYYLLRFSRTNRQRLERLVGFLHDLFGTSAMRTMYSTFLEALRRVTEYVRPDDSSEMRNTAALALKSSGDFLSKLENQADAMRVWAQVTEYVHTEDPIELRHLALYALIEKLRGMFPTEIVGDATPDGFEDSVAVGELIAEYVRPDDATKLRDAVTGLLSRMGGLLNLFGDFGRAEAACKKATNIDPSDAESWRVLAEAILRQGDDARLSEAEDYARRAVDLTPENSIASRTLSEVLACLGKWTEALNWLERSLLGSGEELPQSRVPGLTEPLIRAVAAGHGKRVKRLMEEESLAEPMEPLWHAVRAELGEELEPLPAEIMDTVTEIKSRFSKE